jgi:glyoxylase-like metal-dependent hydrolase (beta-lactamase superfamily II)
VPEGNVEIVGDRVVGLECFPTRGHASHHVSYLHGDGTLYAGDAAGVRLQPDEFVLPPTPPPEFDLDAWLATIAEIERRAPNRLALIHFGVADDVGRHLAELRERLDAWVERAGRGLDEEEFSRTVREDLIAGGADADAYERAMPFWQSHAGLKRFWEKRRQPAR